MDDQSLQLWRMYDIVLLTASLASYSSVMCFSLVANLYTMKIKSKLTPKDDKCKQKSQMCDHYTH